MPGLRHLRGDLQHGLRAQQLWVDLRGWHRTGWAETVRRWWRWPRILRTAPVSTDPWQSGGAIGLHTMCHRGDWLLVPWMLKSFYRFSGVSWPLTIHVQQPLKPSALDHLRRHFPQARLLVPEEAEARVCGRLIEGGWIRCLHWRQRLGIMQKLLDVHCLADTGRVVFVDADVLFFQRPGELVAAAEGDGDGQWFQRDAFDSYTLSVAEAREHLGVPLASRLNSGITVRRREALVLAQVEEWLRSPWVAKPSGHLEQTLHALSASAAGTVRTWSEGYVVDMDSPHAPAGMVCRHYAGPSKRWLTREGIAWLRARGLAAWG